MRQSLAVACVVVLLCGSAGLAQQPNVDLTALPEQIKNLDWKSVDWNSVSPLDQARALMLLDQTLDEIGAQMTAEADLMSQYIDQANLGSAFVSSGMVEPSSLTLQDGQKIAVALLRGPMAQSSYATGISDAQGSVLKAYQQMYTSTCNRKWSGAMDARLQVRSMTRFLEKSGNMSAFNAWVPAEVARQTKAHDAMLAQRQAAAAESQQQQEQQRIQAEQQRLAQQKQQLQQQQQATMQMQQAMATAQQQQQGQSGGGAAPVADGSAYPNYYYGGLGYAGTGAWYRDAAYRGAACERTEARMGGWHGFRR